MVLLIPFAVIFSMYCDESGGFVQKDEMDKRVLEVEGHVSPALSDLFRVVSIVTSSSVAPIHAHFSMKS